MPIPTEEEDDEVITNTVELWCHFGHDSVESGSHVWKEEVDMDPDEEFMVERILDRTQSSTDKSYLYTVELYIPQKDGKSREYVVVDVPRKALSFVFSEGRYQSDLFLEGVFRHEM